MRTLGLARFITVALAIGMATLGGCTVSSDDAGGDAHIIVTFDFEQVAPMGSGTSTAACPPGYDTVAVFVQPLDGSDNPTGTAIVDLFDCTAGIGTSDGLPPGDYQVYIESTDDNADEIFATSMPQIVTLSATDVMDVSLVATIVVDGGFFRLTWTFDGATLDCGEVTGIANVQAIATPLSSGDATYVHNFTCEAGVAPMVAYSDPLVAGTYTLTLGAVDSTGTVLGTVSTIDDVMITAPNGITDLGAIDITTQ